VPKIQTHLALLIIALLLNGCAGLSQVTIAPRSGVNAICAQFFDAFDAAVQRVGVRDGEAAAIKDFPYLRVNRFLASFRDEVPTEPAFQAWVDRLQTADRTARKVEFMNLPEVERQFLQTSASALLPDGSLDDVIQYCGNQLRARDLAEPLRRQQLLDTAIMPAEYKSWQRVVGIYPFSALAFAAGIRGWHKDTLQNFTRDITELPVAGQLVRYAPPAAQQYLTRAELAEILQRSAQNPLNIPEPDAGDQELLFTTFAPTLEVDVATDDDRIGTPHWGILNHAEIDARQPTIYRYISHTRYAGRNLLQLNYTVWFPARPKTGALDLLGGHLDGLTWRVTLTPEGEPWVYDSIHNCGCYHLFFLTRRAPLRDQAETLEEQAFAPQHAPETGPGLTLRIASRTHYIERVMEKPVESKQIIAYQWSDYSSLRSLPVQGDGERRSLFRQDGIVAGSDRLERYFFWPMGIPHPGAMRQRGRHATAFVGRRHFDDPDLFEKNFKLNP
jgi:hypothetical protein